MYASLLFTERNNTLGVNLRGIKFPVTQVRSDFSGIVH